MRQRDVLARVFAGLNERQKQAVEAPASGVLQIVAGPGTGKTKVLVARVAYLLLSDDIKPEHIIVTTFTKKAANEMLQRLKELFKGTEIAVERLLIGTFHSICYRIIQKYGSRIGMANFTIADERDSQQLLSEALEDISEDKWHVIDGLPESETNLYKSDNNQSYRGFSPKSIRKAISALKSKGLRVDQYKKQRQSNRLLDIVYDAYQSRLTKNKLLDFDDCLLYCYQILSNYPVLSHIEHTLVDEFQDTNEVQLQLMYLFAKGSLTDKNGQDNVTVVGDPDQSIYAFRNAQSANFDKMRQHYKNHRLRVITLEENYRSTSGILGLSETLMLQQQGRTGRNLLSQSACGLQPVYDKFISSEKEAAWVALQIKQAMKLPGFVHSDCAILVRSAYQTRALETELTRRMIPYYMVKGRAFWERKEVVAIMDYLRCVANENDRVALLRCVNFPKRGLGTKAIGDLEQSIDAQLAKDGNRSILGIMRGITDGDVACSLGPKAKDALKGFLNIIGKCREMLPDDIDGIPDLSEILDRMFMQLYNQSGLKKEFAENIDWELNIMEVKSQLLDFEMPEEDFLPEYLEEGEEPQPTEIEVTGAKFLQSFAASVRLFDNDPEQNDEDATPKVAISTIHGAKGLEWPIVFVPGVSEGLLPASFAMTDEDSVNEERRCFYVAVTRAKALLFLSSYIEEEGGNRWKAVVKHSRFLKGVSEKLHRALHFDNAETIEHLYQLLGKQMPESIRDVLQEFQSKNDGKLESQFNDYPIEFSTAREMPPSSTRPSSNRLNQRSAEYMNSVLSRKAPVRPQIRLYRPPRVEQDSAPLGSTELDSKGVKRAPTYIPSRPGSKKRLGMR
ncbi:hypothetical protein FDK38_005099 [Candidozyma auris]|nr:hypothetical protein FDK38_005099 [[Candida] auris]